ncbi:7850_t:CDS:2 [Gigaspora margarita]|uniref:7850_t:CDS:1 n=1 Tax=Gigaspora margarita TaxID=4874 RepID=A0ABN7UDE3_GIGMA|nr:7850_t:CDS:2 [Gigaspora margarita]
MLTRRREENSDQVAGLSSPKRIRVGESDHEAQFSPLYFSHSSSSHTYPISSITPVRSITSQSGVVKESNGSPHIESTDNSDEDVTGKQHIIDHLNHVNDQIVEEEGQLLDEEDQNLPCLDDDECEHLKQEAKEKGTQKFIQEYFLEKHISLQKLFYAFDYKLPKRINDLPDMQLLPVLHKIVAKFLRQRQKLSNINTLEQVVELLRDSKNIMVLTGAGVSVSCGIPDFRSENGIYSRLSEFDLDDPQDMFDINYFRDCPDVFYSFAKEIYPSNFTPSPSHYFIKLLEEKGKLLRNYTQNIDTLEQAAGIKNVLQCHGSFATASCIVCEYKVDGSEIKDDILHQRVPRCPKCKKLRNEEDVEECLSIMKPDIVFFGEKLPPEFDQCFPKDREKVDLLIVMGSSLKVAPVSEIMGQIPHRVPQIVINKTPITHMQFDVQLLGDCDVIIPELCRLLEWELVHKKLKPSSKPIPYRFVEPNIYLFEGAVVKGELGDIGVKSNVEGLNDQRISNIDDSKEIDHTDLRQTLELPSSSTLSHIES